MEERKFGKKEVIFKAGDWEMWMYDILDGLVGIYADYGTPDQKLLAELRTEEFFGEMGIVEAMPRSATAVALEPTRVQVITSKDLGDYFKERPARVLQIMEQLSKRLRRLTEDYTEACRTIAELETNGVPEKPEGWLSANMKKFAGIYRTVKTEKR